MTRSDDELAETAAATPATAVDTDPLAQTATTAPGSTRPSLDVTSLGRLRLERVLGKGGMGVVHAAFDPDLERRVAVKLLHASDPEARARLLREARAMAKLSHPNVITVFDVASTDGQDFVTMELVDGETLKDWLARERPSWRVVVEAFVQAGRGLAAAHEAGLVHRDFKPANVLRSKHGKIVVTDFGLSRAASEAADQPMTATGSLADTGPTTRTATGAVLGTPAYMAPEQWTGGAVGPASDQFAFSVALAEALAGKRPFGGDSFDALRTNVLAGPGPLDAVPRQLRSIVRRGLATDPAARWPSMTAMLGKLEGALARRRRWIRASIGAGAGALGIAGLLLSQHGSTPAGDGCPAPAITANIAWSQSRADALAGRDPGAAKLLGNQVSAWRTARATACTATTARSAQLACLDGVMARIDVAARAADTSPAQTTEGTASILVDPNVCLHDPPPRLASPIGADLETALRELRTMRDDGELSASALVASPCARALQIRGRLLALDGSKMDFPSLSTLMQQLKEAAALAERCTEDDWVRAVVLIGLSHGLSSALAHAETAVAAVPVADVAVELDLFHAESLGKAHFDEAVALLERAVDKFGPARPRGQIRAVVALIELLGARSRTADLKRVLELVATWRGRGLPADARTLDFNAAPARWRLGDVAGADTLARAIGRVQIHGEMRSGIVAAVALSGIVVDERGSPVAGAEVVATPVLDSDSAEAASPIDAVVMDRARTGPDGRFSIAKAHGLVVASEGDRRSEFASATNSPLRLVLQPTTRVAGTVDLHGLDPARFHVTLELERADALYDAIGPVQPDGSFVIDHVLRGPARVFAGEYGVTVGDPVRIDTTRPVAGVVVVAHEARPLHIIARNTGMTPAEIALLFVFAGAITDPHPTLLSLKRSLVAQAQGLPASASNIPEIARGQFQPDDLFATLPARPSGQITVCATGLVREVFTVIKSEAALKKTFGNAELACTAVNDRDDVILVDIPPLRKPKTD